MRKIATLLQLVVVLACLGTVLSLTYCQAGTFEFKPPLGGKEVCEHCLTGTFMPHHDHRYKECFDCTTINDPELEIVASPCSRTNDTVIQCKEGYYRRLPKNSDEKEACVKCTKCQAPDIEFKSCQAYSDTGCCRGENYVYNPNRDTPCQERPWFCRKGQYFSLDSFECLPCPPNTFMPIDYHTMTKCMECQNPSEDHLPLHAKILQSCNSTHQAVLGCDEGYFINKSMGYMSNDIGCSLCTRCHQADGLYESRKCDHFHDTVCCPLTNRTNNYRRGASLCQERSWLCRQGQYFSQTWSECRPCPSDTFMSLDYHIMKECMACQNTSGDNLPSHAVVVHPCNSTHPAVIRCVKGYFTNHSMGSNHNQTGCSLCTGCDTTDHKYERRECDEFHDTVCCPRPDMTVIETSDGPRCHSSLTDSAETSASADVMLCGANQYLHINHSNKIGECVSCPKGKYMDELNHTRSICKNCEDLDKRNLDLHPTCHKKVREEDGKQIKSEKAATQTTDFKTPCIVFAILFILSAICNVCQLLYPRFKKRYPEIRPDIPFSFLPCQCCLKGQWCNSRARDTSIEIEREQEETVPLNNNAPHREESHNDRASADTGAMGGQVTPDAAVQENDTRLTTEVIVHPEPENGNENEKVADNEVQIEGKSLLDDDATEKEEPNESNKSLHQNKIKQEEHDNQPNRSKLVNAELHEGTIVQALNEYDVQLSRNVVNMAQPEGQVRNKAVTSECATPVNGKTGNRMMPDEEVTDDPKTKVLSEMRKMEETSIPEEEMADEKVPDERDALLYPSLKITSTTRPTNDPSQHETEGGDLELDKKHKNKAKHHRAEKRVVEENSSDENLDKRKVGNIQIRDQA